MGNDKSSRRLFLKAGAALANGIAIASNPALYSATFAAAAPNGGLARAANVDLAEFGLSAANDAVQNDLAMRHALDHARAVASLGGVRLYCAAGSYNFSLSSAWQLPAGVLFDLGGKARTVWRRTDSQSCNWFEAKNIAGNIGFRGATFVGNSVASANGDGCLLFAELNDAAVQDMSDFLFDDIELQNLRGDGWLFFLCRSGSNRDISQIRVMDSCSFTSHQGNARGPNQRGIWSSCMVFQGNMDPYGSAGRIRNVNVGRVKADIPDIKSLVIVWGGVEDARIVGPSVKACGTGGVGDDSGAYCIMVGNETVGGPNPGRVSIVGPRIDACRSVGVYFVAWGGTNVGQYEFDGTGGHINNVTDLLNSSLPKGAIASTDGPNIVTIKNLVCDCVTSALDMRLYTGARLNVDGVKATNIATKQSGVFIIGQSGNAGPTGAIELKNLSIASPNPGVTGIRLPPCRTGYGDVLIDGDTNIDVSYIGISAYNEASHTPLVQFAHLKLSGHMTLRNAAAGQIVLQNNASLIDLDAVIDSYRPHTGRSEDTRFKYEGCTHLSLKSQVSIVD